MHNREQILRSNVDKQRLQQEYEVFQQYKQQESQWFRLRLVMGYSSIVLLSIVMTICIHILLNHKLFPNLVLSSAGAALFVDLLGLLIAVWKIVFSSDFTNKLSPTTISDQSEFFFVHSATYGKGTNIVDVTELVKLRVLRPKYLEFEVTNENLGGDPLEGTTKELNIVYSYGGTTKTRVFTENKTVNLP